AWTGRGGDEDEGTGQHREVRDGRRNAEILERLDLVGDETEGRADRVALAGEVHTEPRLAGDGVREVEREDLFELLPLLLRENRVHHPLDDRRGHDRLVVEL